MNNPILFKESCLTPTAFNPFSPSNNVNTDASPQNTELEDFYEKEPPSNSYGEDIWDNQITKLFDFIKKFCIENNIPFVFSNSENKNEDIIESALERIKYKGKLKNDSLGYSNQNKYFFY